MSGNEQPDYHRLADIWYGIMNTEPLTNHQLGEWLRGDVGSDSMPQPGFVGRHYKTGGTLLLGMNPGRITEKRETEAEQRFYAALENMRQCTTRGDSYISEAAERAIEELRQGSCRERANPS